MSESAFPPLPQCPRCGGHCTPEGWCMPCAGRELSRQYFGETRDASVPGEAPQVPGWEVQRLLSAGGMGQLWLGLQTDISLCGVIKLVARSAAPEMEKRFEMEAEILASLDHPGILQLLDIVTADDGRLCIITEYIDGCDLRRLLRAEKVPLERALDIFQKVCTAMVYAHEQGIIHRDLKPANILVDASGTVKVADFGLAKELRSTAGGRTSIGDGLGTPYYLAPELLRAAAVADEKADVYSLGVLLYELLTGNVPLGSFAPVSTRCSLSRAWDAVIRDALTEDPAARTPTVQALADAVQRLVLREQQRGRWQGHRRKLGVAVALLLAAAGGTLLNRHTKPVDSHLSFPSPHTATREHPWKNSLGMEFVPLPGTDLLFGRTEVRVCDLEPFRTSDRGFLPEYRQHVAIRGSRFSQLTKDGWVMGEEPQVEWCESNYPAYGVSVTEAHYFCAWLTLRERQEGRLQPNQQYRLPHLQEWLSANGDTPPPENSGNFAGPEAVTPDWPNDRPVSTVADPYPRAAPVGSFPSNTLGICDLAGNVAEWVVPEFLTDDDDRESPMFGLSRIGGSWADLPDDYHEPVRFRGRKDRYRRVDMGLRVVLDLAPVAIPSAVEEK